MSAIHANSLRLEDAGLLILGPSGTGKSAITLALLERASVYGRSGALIADDYSNLSVENEGLKASPPDNITGIIEIRGAGLFHVLYESHIKITHAVQLGEDFERYPSGRVFNFLGISVPLIILPSLKHADALVICQAIEAFLFRKQMQYSRD